MEILEPKRLIELFSRMLSMTARLCASKPIRPEEFDMTLFWTVASITVWNHMPLRDPVMLLPDISKLSDWLTKIATALQQFLPGGPHAPGIWFPEMQNSWEQ